MSITPESVQALLASENFGDRLSAVNQLRQLDPAVAFTLIQPVAMDRNTRVRYAAVSQISSLGEQNRSAALVLLRRCLQDPEPDVQAAAADSLGALKLTDAFEDIKALYERSSEWLVQFSIVAALGELGDPRFPISIVHETKVILPHLIPISACVFRMGTNEEDETNIKEQDAQSWDDEKPAHTISLSEYSIGKYLVTNAEFRCFW